MRAERFIDLSQHSWRMPALGPVADRRMWFGALERPGMHRLLIVFAITAGLMMLIFRFAGWYADTAALPRYCNDPRATIGYVEDILSNPNPVGEARKRPYLVAAKLIFLVPQKNNEGKEDYLQRLARVISAKCATPY
jgi:hypothetical protein